MRKATSYWYDNESYLKSEKIIMPKKKEEFSDGIIIILVVKFGFC